MDKIQALKGSELFADLGDKALAELSERAQWVELKSGMALYKLGDEGDALYLIANGRLSVNTLRENSNEEQRLSELGRYEIVGEIALITGERRSVTVRAVRDSALIRISKEDFSGLMVQHPQAGLRVMRHIVERLRRPRTSRSRDAMLSSRTMAVIPAHEGLPYREFAKGITDALGDRGASLRLDAERVDSALGKGAAQIVFEDSDRNETLYSWLNALEGQYRYVVYEGDCNTEAWTRRCLRQADRILLLVDARREPGMTSILQCILENRIKAPIEVVLLHGDDYHSATEPYGWRDLLNSRRHHQHVGGYDRQALSHIARMISGHALGLVLGGGGARGFAHLGLIRALEERNIPIDLVGGTSIGALVGALCATGYRFDEIFRIMRETFVDQNYLNDFTLSRISLIRGRKLLHRLEDVFGDTRIEQLSRQFFCISTNLTRDEQIVHQRGFLSDWVSTSMSVPGIAPPFVYHGELLVDGGLLNNLPTDVMAGYGRGPVIASDVSSKTELKVEEMQGRERPYQLYRSRSESVSLNMFTILYQTATMTSEEEILKQRDSADLYISMPVQDVGMFDWHSMDETLYRGYHHATELLEQAIADGVLGAI